MKKRRGGGGGGGGGGREGGEARRERGLTADMSRSTVNRFPSSKTSDKQQNQQNVLIFFRTAM